MSTASHLMRSRFPAKNACSHGVKPSCSGPVVPHGAQSVHDSRSTMSTEAIAHSAVQHGSSCSVCTVRLQTPTKSLTMSKLMPTVLTRYCTSSQCPRRQALSTPVHPYTLRPTVNTFSVPRSHCMRGTLPPWQAHWNKVSFTYQCKANRRILQTTPPQPSSD